MKPPRNERLPLTRLRLLPNNPRSITDKARAGLDAVIKRFGLIDQIVWNERSGNIVGGNKRYEILQEKGETEADCRVVDLSPREERALALILNNPEITGEYTEEAIPLLQEAEELLGDDFDLFGLADLADTLADVFGPDEDEEIEEPEELPVTSLKSKIRLGDVVHCGPHRIGCVDVLDGDNLIDLLQGKRVDCVITDPPYAIFGSASGLSSSVADDKMVVPFFRSMAHCLERATREFAHLYIFCDWRSCSTLWAAARSSLLMPKNLLVWSKNGSGLGSMWANTHELIAFYVHEPKAKSISSQRKTGHRMVNKPNVIQASPASGNERHFDAAKPFAILKPLVEAGSRVGETVADPFGGSGQTLLLCEELGRRCISADLEPPMVELMATRWAAATGKVPEVERDGQRLGWADLKPLRGQRPKKTSKKKSAKKRAAAG